MIRLLPFVAVILANAQSLAQTNSPSPPPLDTNGLMGPQEFQALPSHPADHRIPYGDEPDQFGDLRVPTGPGPHPLVVLVHGGCWKAQYSTLNDLAPIADALKADGIATWSIEYRRLGQEGGGWPGTYADVAKALDLLPSLAKLHGLDIDRVVVLGHSAGGHLAMWAAARHRLPKSSPLHSAEPLPIHAVINIAGTADMAAFIPFEQQACQSPVVEEMLGGTPEQQPERYAQSSAARMLPLGVSQTIVWGEEDVVVPRSLGRSYVQQARASGDHVGYLGFPNAGHFDIASPHEATWIGIRARILELLGR